MKWERKKPDQQKAKKEKPTMNVKEREVFTLPTMRNILTGLDMARTVRKPKTTNSRYQAMSIKNLQPHLNESAVQMELEQEKRRFLRQSQSLDRTRAKVRKTRRNLLGRIEKNRRIMALRFKLQKDRFVQAP